MRGSLLITFEESLYEIGGGHYSVTVNGQLRDLHYSRSNNLYSTNINLGDVVTITFIDIPSFLDIDVIRKDYTTDDVDGNMGIVNNLITSIQSGTTVTFTATTVDNAYGYLYILQSSNPGPTPTPTPTPTATPLPCFNLGTGFDNYVSDILLGDNDILYLSGNFNTYKGVSSSKLIALDENGEIYTGFTNSYTFQGGGVSIAAVYAIEKQSDGKIIAVGDFRTYNLLNYRKIIRFNTDGSIEPTFPIDVISSVATLRTIAIQSDDKILIGGLSFVAYSGITIPTNITRLNSDGTLDSAIINASTSNDYIFVNKIIIQNDGKIIIGGAFASYNGISCKSIARLNSDGTFDSLFNFNLNTAFDNNSVTLQNIAIQSNGKIIIVGQFYNTINFINNLNIVRLNTDGTIDTTFNSGIGCNNEIRSTSIQPDGKIIIGGIFTSYDGIGRNRIARINGDSTLDTSLIEKNSMVIYPNPVTNMLQIQTPNNVIISSSRILDISGKLIFEQNTNSNTINTEILTKGFYILEVFSGKDKFTCKFIKE
jgi:uncharacterized delta-60 repeat protein